MNKGKKGKKLHRVAGQRKQLVRSLASSLFLHDQIVSGKAKLQYAVPTIEKWITRAKRNTLEDRRFLYAHLEKRAADRLLNDIAPRMKGRKGGYTRLLSVGLRSQDTTPAASLELTDRVVKTATPKKSAKKTAAKKAAAPKKKTATKSASTAKAATDSKKSK